ncbi:sporulation protein YunB [Paenibacillus durus]|uniref:sporulation protein YunB n=1 Tax=Paenibacillus durus TaxID=44251 RepID=UPI0009DCEF42|nr:sporulation protein YunB [Paenibacillus durus]
MGRIKKWGNRRLQLPSALRLPRISFTPPVRKSSFKSGGSGIFRRVSRNSWGGRGGFGDGGWTASRSGGARFKSRPARASRPAGIWSRRPESGERLGQAADGRRRRPRSRRRFWLLTFLLLLVAVLLGLGYVERHLTPPIVHLAQIRVKQVATEAINKAIASQVASGSSAEKLIDWKTDGTGKISGFMLNYTEHMRITSQATEVIQSTLDGLHNQTEHIPLGQALDSPLIASFGPDIPIKIEPQGAVKVELNTRQQNAGINMILVEVYIHIVTEVAVVVPFDMEPQVVDTEIPVSYLMVVGDVPMYYYDNQGRPVGEGSASAPNIALPAPSSGGGVSTPGSSGGALQGGSGPAAGSPAGSGANAGGTGSGGAPYPAQPDAGGQ